MSTAVMSSSAVYEFGDMLYKNHNSGSTASSTITTTTPSSNQNISSNPHPQPHQKALRWRVEPGQRVVSSAIQGVPTFHHQPLNRRNSSPVTSESITMSSLVNSVSTLLLENIKEQQQEQSMLPAHRKLDRSQSEPAPSALVSAKVANINTSRYKTELCRPFEESGSCKYGDKCQFAHGAHELRNLVRHPKYKTELCRTFHTIGFCPYGPRCHFIHNAEEARTKLPANQTVTDAPPAVSNVKTPIASINNRPKPLSLMGTPFMVSGSTGDSPSPTSSLSQSPTTSVGSFFSPDQDVFPSVTVISAASPPPSAVPANTAFAFGQDFTPLVQQIGAQSPPSSPPVSTSPAETLSPRGSPPPGTPDARLPVFNRLSSKIFGVGGYELRA